MPQGDYPTAAIWIMVPVILLLIALRARRGMVPRKVRIETMWIGPVVFIALAAYVLYRFPPPPSPVVYGALMLATLAGVGVGWMRGRIVKITVNTQTHELTSQTSPWALLVLFGIIAVRMSLRQVLTDHMNEWHISAAALTDGFLVFYAGMICGRRLEIWLRCRHLLAQARAAKAAGEAVATEVTEDHA